MRLLNVLLSLFRILFRCFNVLIDFYQVFPLLMYFLIDCDCDVAGGHGYGLGSIEVLLALLDNFLVKVDLSLQLKLFDIQLLLDLLRTCCRTVR